MLPFLLFLNHVFLDVPPVHTVCICEKSRVYDGWCDVCGVGFVAGVKIPSKLLFTCIDHGHEIPTDTQCTTCKQAIASHGFCGRCGTGYYHGKIYYSSFTHCLAKGTRVDRGQLTCAACMRHIEEGGWCDVCKRGIFGNVAVAESEYFEEAVAAFRRLKLGLAHLTKCELCGIAMYSNGMCPKCNIIYKDGKPSKD